MASVDDQEKQSSKSWLRHALESALIAFNRPAGFLVPVGAAVVCIRAICSFLNALLVFQTEHAILGDWAGKAHIFRVCIWDGSVTVKGYLCSFLYGLEL